VKYSVVHFNLYHCKEEIKYECIFLKIKYECIC
jgi:hypothetical protein